MHDDKKMTKLITQTILRNSNVNLLPLLRIPYLCVISLLFFNELPIDERRKRSFDR